MKRILIAGGPRTGKTTHALALGESMRIPVRHTDDLIGLYGWSEASAEVARWFDEPGPWIVEGVAVVRAIRKWLAAHSEGAPADVLYLGAKAHMPLTSGQVTMTRGHSTVYAEIAGALEQRGLRAEAF